MRHVPSRARGCVRWRLTGAAAMAKSVRSVAGWRRGRMIEAGVGPGLLPVIFCTWRRLERLPRTLAMLAAQDIPVQALIWNNSPEREVVDRAVAAAGIPVSVYHSPRNIGGFGRFYLARESARAGHELVIFVDDDQEFGPGAVRGLIAHHQPRSLAGGFAFQLASARRWSLAEIPPGAEASYVGTGGMVADAAVFDEPRLYMCPRRFWFAEDIWLSFFARHRLGYELRRSPQQLGFVEDGRNQFVRLGWVKDRFVRWLNSRDEAFWDTPSDRGPGRIAQAVARDGKCSSPPVSPGVRLPQ